ncbi:coagulation factor XI-like isoform X2 [Pungitius pungitius]|uniref:coagulation factor XI-like isoform X2 n=1 Tax=Pungitius pungitius TaxID=134920 RepID=UPI002E0D503C
METHLILGILLSLCNLSLGQECRPQLLEDVDFPGSDIQFVFSPDVDHCQQLCTQHPACLFFSFLRADWTRDNSNFYCYLKTSSSGEPNVQTSEQGITSGFSLKPCSPDPKPCLPQLYPGLDFPGADYKTFFTEDADECRRACTQDPACQFFSFLNEVFTPDNYRYKCYLKFSWSVPTLPIVERKADVVSGFSNKVGTFQEGKPVCQGKLFPNTDIPGNDVLVLLAASPGHCQNLCSAHTVCTFFSFVSNDLKCHLKVNNDAMILKAKDGITSGLPARFCWPDNNRRIGQGVGGRFVPGGRGGRPPRGLHQPETIGEGGQYGGEGVPGHPVGGGLPALLPPGTPIHPLFGPRPAPMAPPHEGY